MALWLKEIRRVGSVANWSPSVAPRAYFFVVACAEPQWPRRIASSKLEGYNDWSGKELRWASAERGRHR